MHKVKISKGDDQGKALALHDEAHRQEKYGRPACTPGRAHAEGTRAHHQDFPAERGRDGTGRRRPLKRGAADLAAAP